MSFSKNSLCDMSKLYAGRGKYGKNMGASVFCKTKTDVSKARKMAAGGLGSAVGLPVGVRGAKPLSLVFFV